MTSRYDLKNGSMSTYRSFSTGSPRIGATVMVMDLPSLGSMSFMRTLHARRLTPLTCMASDPHTPCAHDRRNASEPSM